MKRKWSGISFLTSLCVLSGLSLAQAAPVNEPEAMTFAQWNEKGQEAIGRHDYVAAENYFRQAREEALRSEQLDQVTEMDARRAARYINEGEPSRAERILAPYIKPGVNKFMLADYLMALRLCNQPDKVLSLYHEYVKDPQEFPSYGLQTVGDVCLRQGKYRQAVQVYEEVLKRDTPETVPYVQLGYAYSLARLGQKDKALEAYGKIANLNERVNNIICMDGEALLGLGRVGLARSIFALPGKDEQEREAYSLRYARALVNAGQDLQNETLNFRRDEILSGRSYEHEADKLLRRLEKSSNEDIAHEAGILRAANLLHEEMYADSRQKLEKALAEDNADMGAQAVMGELSRTRMNVLTAYGEMAVDNKRNRTGAAGFSYEGHIGGNFFLEADFSRRRLADDELHENFWHESVGLRKQFENWQLQGRWLGYQGTEVKHGFDFSLGYDFNDVTKIAYSQGRRLHEHAQAARAGIKEDFHEVTLSHQLNHLTSLEGSYTWSKLSDGNKYKGYSLALSYLLGVKHNYSDRLRLQYEHGSYDHEAIYDSPWRRVDYGVIFSRKWNLPGQNATFALQPGLGWSRDDDERLAFTPSLGFEFVKQFPHDQQLTVGAAYYRYFHQDEGDNKRKDAYGVNVSYSWGW